MKLPKLQPEFGKRLRAVRLAQGLSQRELAKRAGIGAVHLCRLEHGEKAPSLELHRIVSQIFGLNPGDLLK